MWKAITMTERHDPPTAIERFRRGRWVAAALEVVLLLVLLVVGLDALAAGLDAFGDDTLTTTVHLDEGVAATSVDGFRLDPETAQLTIAEPSWGERLAVAAPPVLNALVIGAVVTLIIEVVRSLREGDPFTRGNARILAQAALVAVIGGAVVVAATMIGPVVVDRGLPDALPVQLEVEGSSASLYAGLLLAAIAQVFHRGCDLRDDLEGVV